MAHFSTMKTSRRGKNEHFLLFACTLDLFGTIRSAFRAKLNKKFLTSGGYAILIST